MSVVYIIQPNSKSLHRPSDNCAFKKKQSKVCDKQGKEKKRKKKDDNAQGSSLLDQKGTTMQRLIGNDRLFP